MWERRWYRPRVAAAAAAVAGGLVLVLALWTRGDAPGIDAAVNNFFVDIRSAWSFRVAGWAARLGGTEVVIPVGMAVAGWISYRRRSIVPLFVVAGALALAAAPASVLKPLLHRPEPGDSLAELGRSYPSGHATSSATVSMVLAALALAGPPWPSPSARSRYAILAAATGVPLVVGLTMVVRSAHWLTDLVAGYVIATAAVMVVMTAAASWEKRRSGVEVSPRDSGSTESPPARDGPRP